MKIPLVDLQAQYAAIRPEMDAAIHRVLDRAEFIGGDDHKAFEQEFAAFCDAKACAAVGNGTDSLYLILRSLGIKAGDEVITVANTFIATSEAISQTGAKVVFVDARDDTLLMDVAAFEAAITPRACAPASSWHNLLSAPRSL